MAQPITHNFWESKALGDIGENFQKQWWSGRGYKVVTASAGENKEEGIDMWVLPPLLQDERKNWISLDCKLDLRCFGASQQATGRVFIETVSNLATGRPSWLYTSLADLLCYLVPGGGLYISRMFPLREELHTLFSAYPRLRVSNMSGNTSEGVALEFDVFETFFNKIGDVSVDHWEDFVIRGTLDVPRWKTYL